MNEITTYGLLGYPLGHSFSKGFFSEKFQKEGIPARYLNFEVPSIEMLDDVLLEHPKLRGFNVTIPYKEAILPHLDHISAEAEKIGAVNVVKVDWADDIPILTGHNTDVVGFQQSLLTHLRPHHREALVLGTGGASKAVFYALKRMGITPHYVSRNAQPGILTYAHLGSEWMERCQIIVNCTPLGMSPNVDTCPDIPYEMIGAQHLLYDLVYNPEETLFLHIGKKQGAQIKNGAEMLRIQALEAWKIWNSTMSER